MPPTHPSGQDGKQQQAPLAQRRDARGPHWHWHWHWQRQDDRVDELAVYRTILIAGAAVLVRNERELADAVVTTLPPDRAAEMAAAAWAACSEGAEVTDAVLDAVGALLDRPRPAA